MADQKKNGNLAEMAVMADGDEVVVDAVWGRLDNKESPSYRNLGWYVARSPCFW
jgi:hypothetical protein